MTLMSLAEASASSLFPTIRRRSGIVSEMNTINQSMKKKVMKICRAKSSTDYFSIGRMCSTIMPHHSAENDRKLKQFNPIL